MRGRRLLRYMNSSCCSQGSHEWNVPDLVASKLWPRLPINTVSNFKLREYAYPSYNNRGQTWLLKKWARMRALHYALELFGRLRSSWSKLPNQPLSTSRNDRSYTKWPQNSLLPKGQQDHYISTSIHGTHNLKSTSINRRPSVAIVEVIVVSAKTLMPTLRL